MSVHSTPQDALAQRCKPAKAHQRWAHAQDLSLSTISLLLLVSNSNFFVETPENLLLKLNRCSLDNRWRKQGKSRSLTHASRSERKFPGTNIPGAITQVPLFVSLRKLFEATAESFLFDLRISIPPKEIWPSYDNFKIPTPSNIGVRSMYGPANKGLLKYNMVCISNYLWRR